MVAKKENRCALAVLFYSFGDYIGFFGLWGRSYVTGGGVSAQPSQPGLLSGAIADYSSCWSAVLHGDGARCWETALSGRLRKPPRLAFRVNLRSINFQLWMILQIKQSKNGMGHLSLLLCGQWVRIFFFLVVREQMHRTVGRGALYLCETCSVGTLARSARRTRQIIHACCTKCVGM